MAQGAAGEGGDLSAIPRRWRRGIEVDHAHVKRAAFEKAALIGAAMRGDVAPPVQVEQGCRRKVAALADVGADLKFVSGSIGTHHVD